VATGLKLQMTFEGVFLPGGEKHVKVFID